MLIRDDVERKTKLEEYLRSPKDDYNRLMALGILVDTLVFIKDPRAWETAERILTDPNAQADVRRRAWFAQLQISRDKGDEAKIADLVRVIQEKEDDPMLFNQLATVYDRPNALEHMEKCAKLTDARETMHPRTKALFYGNYAYFLVKAGRTSEAVEYAEKALSCQLTSLRAVESGVQDMQNTADSLRKQEVAGAHFLLAGALSKSERSAEATEHLDKALRLNKSLIVTRRAEISEIRGEVLAREGKKPEAVEALLQSHAFRQEPKVWERAVRLAAEIGRSEDACRKRVSELIPPLPDYKFRTVDNKEVSLADFASPVLLVNFFFPSCGPCNAEMPHLQKLHEKYRHKGFSVLAINTLKHEDELVATWKEKGAYTFPILLSPGQDYLENKVGQRGAPTNLLVNRARRIVLRTIGFEAGDERALERATVELLEQEQQAK